MCAFSFFWCKFFSSFAEFSYDDYDEFTMICDDSKRVTLKKNNRTYHVDCKGYDINGILIITGLDDCGLVYSDDPNLYHSNLFWSNQLGPVTAVTNSDFYHCSYCSKCKPFNFSSVSVSIEFSFHFFINLKTVRQEQNNWYSNVFAAKSKDNPSWLWW